MRIHFHYHFWTHPLREGTVLHSFGDWEVGHCDIFEIQFDLEATGPSQNRKTDHSST